MAEIINDRLDELDDLRSLGEDDASVEDNSPVVAVHVNKADAQDEAIDKLRDLAEDDAEPEDKYPVVAVQVDESDAQDESIDELRDLAKDDAEPEDSPVVTIAEKSQIEKSPEAVKSAISSKPEEKPAIAIVEETQSDEQAVVALEKSPAPKTEVATSPLSDAMLSDDEDSFNPTFALQVFLFLRYYFIKFFDIVLTGVAIVLETIVALYEAGVFGRMLSPFRKGFVIIKTSIAMLF